MKHDFLQSSIAVSASSLLGISLCASAADAADADTSNSVINASVQEDKVALGPAPTDFGLKYDYYTDCGLVSACSHHLSSTFSSPLLQILELQHHYLTHASCQGCEPHAICYSHGEGGPKIGGGMRNEK